VIFVCRKGYDSIVHTGEVRVDSTMFLTWFKFKIFIWLIFY